MPFSNADFEDIEKIKAIDSFIYRFTKIQNKMRDKDINLSIEVYEQMKKIYFVMLDRVNLTTF